MSMPTSSPTEFVNAMAYEVKVSRTAATELENAVAYIAERFACPRAMKSLLDAYDAAIDSLGANPWAYPSDENMSEAVDTEIRRITVKRHVMRYSIVEENQEVRVYSFLHMLQDAPRRFVVDYLDAMFD